MTRKPEKPIHPGIFIREQVIPQGMSVTDAAKRLGVGRPALSNLLNGNSSLSPTMAVRLEKSFGADQQELFDLQAAFDLHNRRGKENAVVAHTYVPSFLTIKARQIDDWAKGNIDARHLLPVLLRKLVHSTGHGLRRVDFPGYDNAERKGWDGQIEADAATPWIPEGKSGWEFGTNQNPTNKAEHDYANRASVSPDEKAECTFVFVTPRKWPGKIAWAQSKNAEGDWKAVRALDASDIEQWLEESVAAQIWLAERLVIPTDGFETLDRCWQRWSEASEPKMTPAIFEPSIIAYRNSFKEWLEKPSEKPFVVAADSKDEALAFLVCLFRDDSIQPKWKDLVAVFDSGETLRKLIASNTLFTPVIHSDETARELAGIYRTRHCIVVQPRNAIDSNPDIALDLLNQSEFGKALVAMGIDEDQADRLARVSGRSPTILRRNLSEVDAIRKPQWAGDIEIAKSLIPVALVGAWHTNSNADCEILSTLADTSYPDVERSVAWLLKFDDCPVWSVGSYRGVASKIDTLFAISWQMTEKDLKDFFFLAEYVLSENDPALDLPEDKRWAAGLYGKIRKHSAALREGICETLVILSIHGNNLFQERLGIDVEAHVSSLVQKLLTPLSLDKLLSHDKDLPNYAEAAPGEFLNLLEDDLRQVHPAVLGLLKPVAGGALSSPTRTGLLWALECLAWQHLGRVSLILAQLSRTVIEDNWVNKPISSILATYRSWLPQTAASLGERMQALEVLTKRFPDVGWQVCIDQLDAGPQMALPSHRPRWRSDASGAGRSVTQSEFHEFTRKALDLALAWKKHDPKTLGDLVERLPAISEESQTLVWDLIDAWADSETEAGTRASLGERIRLFMFTVRGQVHALSDATKNRARMAYEKLQPRDSVLRHTWLFANDWIEFSDDDMEDGRLDPSKHEERIRKLRAAAIKEIWAEGGFEGVVGLLSRSAAPDTIGGSLGSNIAAANERTDFLRQCLSTTGDVERKVDGCVNGFLRSMCDEEREALLLAVAGDRDADQIVRLFRCAPFNQDTWRLLDRYGQETQDRYWQEVFPSWNRHNEAELIELIDRLLEAKRPRAAFRAVALPLHWPRIETSRLKRLLFAVATVDAEPADWHSLDSYYISAALDSLDGRPGVSTDEMAQLEFMFIAALEHSEHGIPNLERQIAETPPLFVQALGIVYRRKDDGQDPPEWQIEDPKRRVLLADAAHRLLFRIGRVPGTGPDGKLDAEALLNWITAVRWLCAEYGRVDIGDEKIGELLSKAPAEEDGAWPCLPVCEAMERIASQQIGIGFNIGVFNGRGVHSRELNEGGAQERELAAKYRAWAKLRAFDYPYVSDVLESIAASYDRDAKRVDTKVQVRKRLEH